jgi:glutamate racemase
LTAGDADARLPPVNPSSENRTGPIGVFDSGIGGLTVFRELLRHLSGQELVYFGDSARVPYGTKSGETVTRFSLEAADFLMEHENIKALVVACYTASAYAIPALEKRLQIPIVGVIESGAKAAVDVSDGEAIGVIGTSATVASGAYERAIHSLSPEAEIFTQACPLFVPLAEEGWIEHEVTHRVAEEYLGPLKTRGVGSLILGCTHYPLLKGVIQEVMGPGVILVDAGEYTAQALSERLGGDEAGGGEEPEHKIFLTDLPQAFRTTSERFLGRPLPPVELVTWHEEGWVRT